MRFNIILFALFLVFVFPTKGQDTSKTLNANQLISWVKKYHPIVRQTEIEIGISESNITIARGGFDPKIKVDYESKTFNGTNYFEYLTSQVALPAWYGIEFKGGIEQLYGDRLDPTLTNNQSSFVGVNFSLAKNLVIDKRRAALKQAKVFNSMAYVQQKAMVNDLLLEAIEQYWNWVAAYQKFEIMNKNVEINLDRFKLVKRTFELGERPAIDTIEALAQLQNFQYLKNNYWLEFQNSGLLLSAFLWMEGDLPYFLPENIIPVKDWDKEEFVFSYQPVLENLLIQASLNHPELNMYNYKLDALEIERKLKFQELLPVVNFQYNQLGKGFNLATTAVEGPIFRNNYKYGFNLELPMTFAKGRGDYKIAKLKIENTALDRLQKSNAIEIKVKSYFNQFVLLQKQIELQTLNYENYRLLVKAEEFRFQNGESSLFLINSRENKALESLEKLIENKVKLYKTIFALQWSAGLLN
jgi:outer membrane protein TolC